MEDLKSYLDDCLQTYRSTVKKEEDGFECLMKFLPPLFCKEDRKVYETENVDLLINFLKKILSGNVDYDTYIQQLKDKLPAHQRCHCVFITDCILYRCNDCSSGESSCLCAECFEAGNHEGHHFKRYSSNCGGCCDCGDPESWKREGWCKKHQEAVYVPDADLRMDPIQRRDAMAVFRFSSLLLSTLFNTYEETDKETLFHSLVSFIKDWCDLNQSTLRLVTRCYEQSYSFDELYSLLEQFNYHIPKIIKFNPEYKTIDLSRVIIRSIVVSHAPDDIAFLFLSFIFDSVYRNWFVLAYTDEVCNMLLDSLTIMTHDSEGRYLDKIIEETKNKEKGDDKDKDKERLRQRLTALIEEAAAANDANAIVSLNQLRNRIAPSNELSAIPIVECTGYQQFIQSLHCQFFHTDSSIFLMEGFQKFFRQFLYTAATMMNEVISLFGRNRVIDDTPQDLLKCVTNVLSCIYALTEDADDYIIKAFDEIEVDNEKTIVPCDELIDFLLSYQNICFIEWKSELSEQYKTEYFYVVSVLQQCLAPFYRFYLSLFEGYSDKQKVMFVYHSLLKIATYCKHSTADEDYIRETTKGDWKDYRSGRYVYHALDSFCLDLLSLIVKYNLVEPFSHVLTDKVVVLMKDIVKNSMRGLACISYYFSLGGVRFTNAHSYMVGYDRIYTYSPAPCEGYIFAIQLGALFFPTESIMEQLFGLFSNGVVVQLNDKKEEAAVGVHLMLSYFLFILCTIVYNRGYSKHDMKTLLKNDLIAIMMTVSDGTLENIFARLDYSREPKQEDFELAKQLSECHFDSDSMMSLYRVKNEYLKDFCVFTCSRDMSYYSRRIEYIKEHLNIPCYVVPEIKEHDCFSLMIHRILGNPFTVLIIYHLLQRQYVFHNNDPKLLEALLYVIQMLARCRGEKQPEKAYDLQLFREYLNTGSWSDSGLNVDLVDCRSLLWMSILHTPIINDTTVEFKLPNNIVGLLSFLYHDPTFPQDLKKLLMTTMEMCVRPECESDAAFISFVTRERESQKRSLAEVSTEQPCVNEAITELNSKLDDFLNMYSDSEESVDEEQLSLTTSEVMLSESFTCALCHGDDTTGIENTPLLLCHVDDSKMNILDSFNGLYRPFTISSTSSIQEQTEQVNKQLQMREEDREFMDTFYRLTRTFPTPSSIVSCTHMMHKKCFEEYYKKRNTDLPIVVCPVCRRLINGSYPVLQSPCIQREWRDKIIPNSLFQPDHINLYQWKRLNELNNSAMLSSFVNSWEGFGEEWSIIEECGCEDRIDYYMGSDSSSFVVNSCGYNVISPSITHMEISTRQLSAEQQISFYPFVSRFENNRAIIEPHAIRTLQQAFLTDAMFSSRRFEDSNDTFVIAVYQSCWMETKSIVRIYDKVMKKKAKDLNIVNKPSMVLERQANDDEKKIITYVLDSLAYSVWYNEYGAWEKGLAEEETDEEEQAEETNEEEQLEETDEEEQLEETNEEEQVGETNEEEQAEETNEEEQLEIVLDEEGMDNFFRSIEDYINRQKQRNRVVNNYHTIDLVDSLSFIKRVFNHHLNLLYERNEDNGLPTVPKNRLRNPVFSLLWLASPSSDDSVFETRVEGILDALESLKKSNRPSYQLIVEEKVNAMVCELEEYKKIKSDIAIQEQQRNGITEDQQAQLDAYIHLLQLRSIKKQHFISKYFIEATYKFAEMYCPKIMNPSDLVIQNAHPFDSLMNQLLTCPPLSVSSNHGNDLPLLDRYLSTAVTLIPQYYITAIQQACFTIMYLTRTNHLSFEEFSDYKKIQASKTLVSYFDCYRSLSYETVDVHCSYENSILTTLKECGIEKAIEMLTVTYLRECVILLFVLSDYSSDSTYILSMDYQELVQYLNLPSVTEIDSLLGSDSYLDLLNTISLDGTSLLFMMIDYSRQIGEKNKATFVLSQPILQSSIFMDLPKDIRVFNYMCHKFHDSDTDVKSCERCKTCAYCQSKTSTPILCMSCGRCYCSDEGEISKCRCTPKRYSVCYCRGLINTVNSSVYIPIDDRVHYPFGSVYYTNNGSVSTKGLSKELLLLNKQAKDIFELIVKNDAVWYKSTMVDKCSTL